MKQQIKWFIEQCFDSTKRSFPLVKMTLILAPSMIALEAVEKMPDVASILVNVRTGEVEFKAAVKAVEQLAEEEPFQPKVPLDSNKL